ncbi:MAG: 30S ribosomal protein S6 [Lentisphaerae bacterium]|nr:MAG: 30S ribosomal protein S6 [Lentisphaerota bacterium]
MSRRGKGPRSTSDRLCRGEYSNRLLSRSSVCYESGKRFEVGLFAGAKRRTFNRRKWTLKKYEAIFILDERRIEGDGSRFLDDAQAIVEEMGGKVLGREDFGRRQFAYPIRKRTSGHYWILSVELPEEQVAAFRARFTHDEQVLRLVVQKDMRPEAVTG